MSSSRRQYPFHLIEPGTGKKFGTTSRFFAPSIRATKSQWRNSLLVRHKLSGKVFGGAALPEVLSILDMFPYPSGAGLHVGHPGGIHRYGHFWPATNAPRALTSFTSYGLGGRLWFACRTVRRQNWPVSAQNHWRKISPRLSGQIKALVSSYDCLFANSPRPISDYFARTQWIFLKLYNSYFDPELKKAQPIGFLEDALSGRAKVRGQMA